VADDQDAAGIRPVPGDKRPRPAPPPASAPQRRRQYVLRQRPGDLRRIPDLFRDTFLLIGRRWRPLGEYAVVGAAGYVVAFVMLFLGLNALFGGRFFAKFNELSDPTDDTLVDFGAWLESFDVTPTATAITLLVLFLVASALGYFVQNTATTLAAFDDVNGRDISVGSHLATAFRRMPKIFLLTVAMCAAACGPCLLFAFITPGSVVVPFLLLWALAAIVFAPLFAIYFVMAYLEPGLPSPRRWWRLMQGRKAAIWGRMILLTAASLVVGFVASLMLGLMPLPELYGDLIANVIVSPMVFAVLAVAHLLVYADLMTGEQPADPQADAEPLG